MVPGKVEGDGRPALGVALMAIAALLLPCGDAIGKHLAGERGYGVVQIVWVRYLVQCLLVGAAALALHGRGALGSRRPGLLVARGLLLLPAHLLLLLALRHMPLADAVTVLFLAPVLVALLAVPLLGERLDARGWVAVAAGFAGAAIVLRPGTGLLHWAALLPLAVALIDALFQILTRHVRSEPTAVVLLYTSLVVFAGTSVFVPFAWRTPEPVDWLAMIGLGGVSALVHYLIVKALGNAPAPLIAPIAYLQLVGAAAVGYLAFGDVPGVPVVLGAAVILASGLTLLRRAGRGHAGNGQPNLGTDAKRSVQHSIPAQLRRLTRRDPTD